MHNSQHLNSYNFSETNVVNLQALIDTLTRAKNSKKHVFDMKFFQDYPIDGKYAETVDEVLHTCGTTCCIAGFLAVMPEFHKFGGERALGGRPALKTGYRSPHIVMAEFLQINTTLCDSIINYEERLWNTEYSDEIKLEDAIGLFEEIKSRATAPSVS